MHESKLRKQYLYQNQKRRDDIYEVSSKNQTVKQTNNNFKIFTKNLNLEVDYNLPLKQLQYTKTRTYKQNLNPIFQQLQTTQNRYSYSKNINNDPFDSYDKSFLKQSKIKKQKVNQFKERSRILSQNIKKNQKNITFGESMHPIQKNNFIGDKQSSFLLFQNKSQRIKPESDKIKIQDKNSKQEKQFEQFFIKKGNKKISSNSNQLNGQQRGKLFIKDLMNKIEKGNSQILQKQQKLQMLRKQVQMHKQKNLLKQRQIYYFDKQKQVLESNEKELKQKLNRKQQKYSNIEMKHHETNKQYRNKKNELKKQQNWLRQQNIQIKSLQKKFQQLLRMIRQLQQQEQKRQIFWKQLQQQSTKNQQLKMYLQQAQNKINQLNQQNQLIQNQISTLELHQQQLINLQSKFKTQTDVLILNFNDINKEIINKQQFIQQQSEINDIVKQLELEVAQINQKIIIITQDIQDIHVKISLKKRNIKYIQNKQPQRKDFIKQNSFKQTQNTLNDDLHEVTFQQKKNKYQQQKPPLPTIRQQSKNTSAYQSPKQQNQKSFHPFESNSLQIDSRMISRTQIFKPHQDSDKKKKYFVIESEDDGLSNMKSSFKQRNSDEMFIQRQKKPSIEERLYQVEDLRLRTDNDDKRSYSVQLSSGFMEQQVDRKKQKKEQQLKKKIQSKIIKKQNSSIDQHIEQQQAIQSLISRYQQIKSNSFFQQSWKQKK